MCDASTNGTIVAAGSTTWVADLDGLLVAGRCISATHEALGAIRVMPPAFAMGQAAGAAAALAVEWGRPPRAIPVPQLQEVLVRQGAYLGKPVTEQAGQTFHSPASANT